MSQAKTLTAAEIERLLFYINTRKYSARNRSMMLLTHWAGLRIGEVACNSHSTPYGRLATLILQDLVSSSRRQGLQLWV
jgi:hypothetical protein